MNTTVLFKRCTPALSSVRAGGVTKKSSSDVTPHRNHCSSVKKRALEFEICEDGTATAPVPVKRTWPAKGFENEDCMKRPLWIKQKPHRPTPLIPTWLDPAAYLRAQEVIVGAAEEGVASNPITTTGSPYQNTRFQAAPHVHRPSTPQLMEQVVLPLTPGAHTYIFPRGVYMHPDPKLFCFALDMATFMSDEWLQDLEIPGVTEESELDLYSRITADPYAYGPAAVYWTATNIRLIRVIQCVNLGPPLHPRNKRLLLNSARWLAQLKLKTVLNEDGRAPKPVREWSPGPAQRGWTREVVRKIKELEDPCTVLCMDQRRTYFHLWVAGQRARKQDRGALRELEPSHEKLNCKVREKERTEWEDDLRMMRAEARVRR